MTKQDITQAEKGFMWLQLSELFQNVAGVVGTLGLGLIPAILFVAVVVFIAGGNVTGVFLWLGILEIISWALFGLCMLLGKHYKKKFLELAGEEPSMAVGTFGQAYLEAERELRKECDEMVRNGELSEEDAEFRFQMVRDEILESMALADID